MAQPTKEEIKRELDRINPEIDNLMNEFRELKAKITEAKSNGDTKAMKEFKDQMDKIDARKNSLKTDRQALLVAEQELGADA